MEKHLDLTIFGGDLDKAVAALVSEADDASGDWTRGSELVAREERMRREFHLTARQHCFGNRKLAAPAVLFVQDLRPYDPPRQEWRVGHIGALDGRRSLDVTECNAAVKSFYAWAAPILEREGVMVSLSSERQGPRDWMSPKLAQLLDNAVDAGYPAHEMEEDFWHRFLIGAYQSDDDVRMTTRDLEGWLTQDRNWDYEDAHRLALAYESGLDLLAAYDKLRGLGEA